MTLFASLFGLAVLAAPDASAAQNEAVVARLSAEPIEKLTMCSRVTEIENEPFKNMAARDGGAPSGYLAIKLAEADRDLRYFTAAIDRHIAAAAPDDAGRLRTVRDDTIEHFSTAQRSQIAAQSIICRSMIRTALASQEGQP